MTPPNVKPMLVDVDTFKEESRKINKIYQTTSRLPPQPPKCVILHIKGEISSHKQMSRRLLRSWSTGYIVHL